MKKQTVGRVLASGMFVALLATVSVAQTAVKADIPFDFVAAGQTIAAGEYSVSPLGMEPFSPLLVRGQDRRGLMAGIPCDVQRAEMANSKLLFHRYGDDYFLWQIWSSADNSVRTLSQSRAERKLAKSGATPELAVVIAHPVSANGN